MRRGPRLGRARDKNARLAAHRSPGVGSESAGVFRVGGEFEIYAEVVTVIGVDVVVAPLVAAAQTHSVAEAVADVALKSVSRVAETLGAGAACLPDAGGKRRREAGGNALLHRQIKTAQSMLAAAGKARLRVAQRMVVVAREFRVKHLIVNARAETAVAVASAVKEEGGADDGVVRNASAMHHAQRPVQAGVGAAGNVGAVPRDDGRLQESDVSNIVMLAQRDNRGRGALEVVVLGPQQRGVDAEVVADAALSGVFQPQEGSVYQIPARIFINETTEFVGLARGRGDGRGDVVSRAGLGRLEVVGGSGVAEKNKRYREGEGRGQESAGEGRHRLSLLGRAFPKAEFYSFFRRCEMFLC